VGVFWIQSSQNPQALIATGTIVGPSLVLTLVGEENHNKSFLQKTELFVVSGLTMADVTQTDSNAQVIAVNRYFRNFA